MNGDDEEPRAGKRTDVGYKRPPAEHQFKSGQKPPPRKRRAGEPESTTKLLARILAEERRLGRGTNVRWLSNAYLLIEVAFQLAEEGNQGVARALAEYLLAADKPEPNDDPQPRVEEDPDGPTGVFHYARRVRI
jgi:hypothetical protein